MPGCSSLNCSNSSEKGFLMKHFPRDPIRRNDWLIRMKRDNWKPTNYTCLCEVHFAPEMWEKTRVDGTRVLKCTAIPTIFPFSHPDKWKKVPNVRDVPEARDVPEVKDVPEVRDVPEVMNAPEVRDVPEVKNVPEVSDVPEVRYIPEVRDVSEDEIPCVYIKVENLSPDIKLNTPPHSENVFHVSNINSNLSVSVPIAPKREVNALEDSLKKLEKMYWREHVKFRRYKNLYINCIRKYNLLKEQMSRTDEESTFLNRDQILALKKRKKCKSTKLMKWSTETITKALKLKIACGNNGYKELLKQGYPLPSLRTLQRTLKT